MFAVLVFIIIFLIAFFGDYESKEIEKDYEYFKEVCSRNSDETTKSK